MEARDFAERSGEGCVLRGRATGAIVAEFGVHAGTVVVEAPPQEVAGTIARAVEAVLAACAANGWASRDIDELRSALADLRKR